MPVDFGGQDDVLPSERRCVRQESLIVQRTGPGEVAGRFVHGDRVPKRDGGDDEVERHGAFPLAASERS